MENWTLDLDESRKSRHADPRAAVLRSPCLGSCNRTPHVSPATLSLVAHFNPRHGYISLEPTRWPASSIR